MNHPLVSVIIIFYNAERFFEEAIQSVFEQTCSNWELLLVDDGSTDNSTQMALAYSGQHPDKIFYLEHDQHENRGMSATRNLGIRHARGKYIAFLDADDVWMPEKLEEQVRLLEENQDADMVYGKALYWHSWNETGNNTGKDHLPSLTLSPNVVYRSPDLILRNYPLGKSSAPCPSEILIRRELVERVGGFEEDFTEMFQFYEDQPFLAKVYLNGNVLVTEKSWIKYRIHPDSISSQVLASKKYNKVRLFFLKWLENYLRQNDIAHKGVWNEVRKALRRTSPSKGITRKIRMLTKKLIPKQYRRTLKRLYDDNPVPPPGKVKFGSFRRLKPISSSFGFDRGLPVDRFYIEKFLEQHSADIRGSALEIGDNHYTLRFGGAEVVQSDILHVTEGNPEATIVADLARADHIPSDQFDCIIFTQTLHLIYDVRTALATLHRILKPGGVLLATFPGLSQMEKSEWGNDWYWGFTNQSARKLFEEVFPAPQLEVAAYGNVLVSIAFLQGLAAHELKKKELDYRDEAYDLLIAVRAVK